MSFTAGGLLFLAGVNFASLVGARAHWPALGICLCGGMRSGRGRHALVCAVTARGTWKAYELRVAKDMGGRRIPVTGLDRHGEDVVSPMFGIQCKLRKSLPAWLWEWLDGIVGVASQSGRIGVLVLRTPRMKDADALVVLRYQDWVSLHGTTKDEDAA